MGAHTWSGLLLLQKYETRKPVSKSVQEQCVLEDNRYSGTEYATFLKGKRSFMHASITEYIAGEAEYY